MRRATRSTATSDHLDLREGATRYQPRSPGKASTSRVAIEFHTPYGCSKGAADQYMLDYARGFGLNTVVFRHSTIYGGRQFATYDQGWVGWFCRQAIESKADPSRRPSPSRGDGKQVRDLLHISDAVRCYVAAYQNMSAARGQAFNIGGGMENSMSLLELLRYLEDRLGLKLNYTHLPLAAKRPEILRRRQLEGPQIHRVGAPNQQRRRHRERPEVGNLRLDCLLTQDARRPARSGSGVLPRAFSAAPSKYALCMGERAVTNSSASSSNSLASPA